MYWRVFKANRFRTGSCLSALMLATALVACHDSGGGSGSSAPPTYSLGASGAPIVFVKAFPLYQGTKSPLIGFDISYVDATNRTYYLASPQYAGVVTVDLDTITESVPNVNVIAPSGANAFAGNQTDVNDPNVFPGGPNGVTTANGGKELWAADANTYTGNIVNGVASNLPDYSNDNCDSSVKVITLATMATSVVKINGCFKSDELGYDPDDNVVLVANPEEKPNGSGYVGSTGTAFTVNIPSSVRSAGVPTGPFVTLIDANAKSVLKQIAFDGTNGTPNATNGIEQPVYSSATKLFYISVPADGLNAYGYPDSNGVIAVVNPTTYVVTKIPLTNCNPTGMALGPDGKEVFLACNSATGPQVVSLVDGSLISAANQFAAANAAPTDAESLALWNMLAQFGAQYGCDEAWFNSALNQYMAVCNFTYNNANLTVANAGTGLTIPGNSASNPQILSTNTAAMTALGAAHSVASDSTSGAIIVPLPSGDPICTALGEYGCIGIWAPQGSTVQMSAK
jgi:hypothetical protein